MVNLKSFCVNFILCKIYMFDTIPDFFHWISFAVNKLFISGPVVVSPKGCILFKTVYPKDFKVLEAKWIKTMDNESTEIDFSEDGYSMRNRGGNPQTQSVEIPSSKDNVVSFQLCYDNMKSNIIIVFPYGIVPDLCY